jgi:DNA-binding Xre family transcriptional regulator
MKPKRGNIFVRELEEILARRNLRLGHLDDRIGIHPEKVRRLQQSLLKTGTFPTLTPEELEDVITMFNIGEREKYRLYAAVIAANVSPLILKRIDDPENAFLAIEQIFPAIFQALWTYREGQSGLGSFRGDS